MPKKIQITSGIFHGIAQESIGIAILHTKHTINGRGAYAWYTMGRVDCNVIGCIFYGMV